MGVDTTKNDDGRAKIRNIVPGSPAESAGLDRDDIIYAIDSRAVDFDGFTKEIEDAQARRHGALDGAAPRGIQGVFSRAQSQSQSHLYTEADGAPHRSAEGHLRFVAGNQAVATRPQQARKNTKGPLRRIGAGLLELRDRTKISERSYFVATASFSSSCSGVSTSCFRRRLLFLLLQLRTDELQNRQIRSVSQSPARPDDPRVTARTIGKSRRQIAEQLFGSPRSHQESRRLASRMQRIALAERDHFLRQPAA